MVGCYGRVFGTGEGYADECGSDGPAVVGDFENVLLDRRLDIRGVEGIGGLWIPANAGMTGWWGLGTWR